MIMKKLIIFLAMENSIPDIVTKNKRFYEENREKCLEKGRQYYE